MDSKTKKLALIGAAVVAVGAGVVVSQYLGAKDKKETRIAVHTSLAIAVILGLILTVGGIAVSRSLLVWMNTPKKSSATP